MTSDDRIGCLGMILRLFGIDLGRLVKQEKLPYRLRDDFLSPAEFSFYRVLRQTLGERVVVCPKVNLGDLFFVPRSKDSQSWKNKIDRKHVDFVLCEPETMKPRCGVELDDASHGRADRIERDAFVKRVFDAAGLPLVRVPAKRAYQPAELLALIEPCLTASPVVKSAALSPGSGPPLCPKCGVPMVPRVATKGANAGGTFFGCVNYPRCRETIF